MKKFLVLLTSLLLVSFLIPTGHASFYPNSVRQLCDKAQKSKLVDSLIDCTHAKLEIAEKYLDETYASALKNTSQSSSSELISSQKQWANSVDIFCPYDAEQGPFGEYEYSRCVLDMTISRAFELEISLLPQPRYPKGIEKKCTNAKTLFEKATCVKEKFAFENKKVEETFKLALEKSLDKESLEKEQEEWIKEREEVCSYDERNGLAGDIVYLECLLNRTVIRLNKLSNQ